MRWTLSECEKNKIRGCIQTIEYPSKQSDRSAGLIRLLGYLDGGKQITHGVSRAYHVSLIPLLYSIVQQEQSETSRAERRGEVRAALRLLDSVAMDCSKKHVSFLMNSDRFKLIVAMLSHEDMESALLIAKLISTLLKIDDSIKELFWELHLHQIVRKSLTNVLTTLKNLTAEAVTKRADLMQYTCSLLDVLAHSTGNVRHRQELYGSGYGLCNQLFNTMLSLGNTRNLQVQQLQEKLILAVAMLVRENKLNQDDFRKQPKQGYLTTLLTCTYTYEYASHGLRYAIDLLVLYLNSNDGVKRIIIDEIKFTLDEGLDGFLDVLLSGLENLKRHHYDVDAVVRSLRVIEESLVSNDELTDKKNYFFRNCHGAWPLLFLCLNNIDERIMYQACCLTAKLVLNNPWNQSVFLEMDGIETLSEILSDYNLDIQLVGLQILDALRASENHGKHVADPSIIDFLLKCIQDFPSMFTKIIQQHKSGSTSSASPTPAPALSSVTTPDVGINLNVATWEKQVSIMLYSLALIGEIVVKCSEVRSTLLERAEDGLLQVLSSSFTHINCFYAALHEQGGDSKDSIRSLIRARTAPGRITLDGTPSDGTTNVTSTGPGLEAVKSAHSHPPLKKLSSSLVKVLLSIVEAASRALTNVVRRCPEAQWRFHKNGGTDSALSFLNCLVMFSEKQKNIEKKDKSHSIRAEHEAWKKVHSTPGDALQDISYVGQALSVLQSAGEEDLEETEGSTVGKSMYMCQNCWLVDPELVASLLLLLVNTSEANREIQSALCEAKVRLLLHYLTSHPSNVVVNSALLLISHLCFNNSASQRYFATPYIVQRLQSLTAVSYIRLVQGASLPSNGLELNWTSEHLHLLTPPEKTDPSSFFAFQSLAYAFICLANLLQIYPAAVSVVVSARVQVNGENIEWTKLLAQCLSLACYPIQDAAITLLNNVVSGATPEERSSIVDFFLIESLTKLIIVDRSDDNTHSCTESTPTNPPDTTEVKWLGNRAFQLLLNMHADATHYVLLILRVLIGKLPNHVDIDFALPEVSDGEVVAFFASLQDEVDIYNSIVNYLPIINGLSYASEPCRKACMEQNCWGVVSSLSCKIGIELDVMICSMYILSNTLSHSKTVPAGNYATLVEERFLDTLAKVILRHPFEGEGEEHINMLMEYTACVPQLASQLILRVGLPVGGVPVRQFFVQEQNSDLLKLAEREARHPTTPSGSEALGFILLLAEDDSVAETYIGSPNVQELLLLCLAEQNLPQTSQIMVCALFSKV